ncbi:hypothetical protein JST99_01295 [Candidatus Dependentiae bacterium]|nr:hypothetical protein [Candidatus Dependentiae bacterium]MCC7415043.1 hypothetical protein [Campylobacterota bacterium]
MKKMLCLVRLSVISCSIVCSVRAATVTVKLLKTDQGTWDRQFAYFISTRTSEKKSKIGVGPLVIREATLEMPTKYSAEKFIRKDGKVTFERESEDTVLYVCTKLNVREPEKALDVCKSLSLNDFATRGTSSNLVVGIDKNGVPSVMTQAEANKKIADSGKPPMHAVKVRKVGNNTAAWTVKVIRSDDGVPAPDVILSRITIKRNSSFKLDSLKVPRNREFFITVNDEAPQKFKNIAVDAVLNINDDRIVEIGGMTAAVLAAQEEERKKKKAEHDAQVAQAKEKQDKAKEEKRAKEEALLEKKVRFAQANLIRAQSKKLSDHDQADALELLANHKRDSGDTEGESRVRPAIDTIEARKKLTKEDKEVALNLLLEQREIQLETAQLNLQRAQVSARIHLPGESGAALTPPTGAKEVHVKR